MSFSIASRLRRGGSTGRLLIHAALRSVLLIALGIVLRSLGRDQTHFTFEDTLTQIGLGYFPVFCVALWLPPKMHLAALALVLIGFWGLYAASPKPPPDFDYRTVGVPPDWPHHRDGFASRYNKNSNVSWRFDVWFLNLFPRERTFQYNGGGYSTLSFVPTMGTMLIGLIAGTWFRDIRSFGGRMQRLVLGGLIGIALGMLLNATDICPLVKRIWTPSFALYSGGCCLWWLAALHWICDRGGYHRWSFPFVVIGANSILIYVMSWTFAEPIRGGLLRHFGTRPFSILGEELVPLLSGAAAMGLMYLVLRWLYRRRVFIKI
jgi:heparan-alpha-glucosaminide N-acetyltransferase